MPDPNAHALDSRVLVVDDDRDLRDTICDLLLGAGYISVAAADGQEALNYLLEQRPAPAVIVLDLMMPTMSGWELIAIVRSYRRLARIPIIVMTAGTMSEMGRKTVAQVFSKPFKTEELLAAIAALVESDEDR